MESYEALNRNQHVSEVDPFTPERYRQFHRWFPAGAHDVLDLGCNTGRGGRVLKTLDPHLCLTGVDCVADRLEQLPPGAYDRAVQGLSTSVPLPDLSVDVVVAGEIIEHLNPADVDQSLHEILRVLRRGGRLLLTTPNPGDIKKRVRGQSVLDDPSHLSQHTVGDLSSRLQRAGFVGIGWRGSGKMTRIIGERWPLHIYGSYLMWGDKP